MHWPCLLLFLVSFKCWKVIFWTHSTSWIDLCWLIFPQLLWRKSPLAKKQFKRGRDGYSGGWRMDNFRLVGEVLQMCVIVGPFLVVWGMLRVLLLDAWQHCALYVISWWFNDDLLWFDVDPDRPGFLLSSMAWIYFFLGDPCAGNSQKVDLYTIYSL